MYLCLYIEPPNWGWQSEKVWTEDGMEVAHGDSLGWRTCVESHVFYTWRTLLGHYGALWPKVLRLARLWHLALHKLMWGASDTLIWETDVAGIIVAATFPSVHISSGNDEQSLFWLMSPFLLCSPLHSSPGTCAVLTKRAWWESMTE